MDFLQEAFLKSIHAIGNSDPNPPVGAILVDKNQKIIGSGYTQPFGGPHAEVMAIDDARNRKLQDSIPGSTLYVTLEPCSHFGKTPPCTTKIIESQIKKVVIACIDPTEKVEGLETLKSNNILVELANQDNCSEQIFWTLNAFCFAQLNHKPRITLKWAQTKSGWLAPLNQTSGRISCDASREFMFRMRKILNSVLVTPATVYYDRPLLTPRYNHQIDLPLKGNHFLNQILKNFENHNTNDNAKYYKRFIMLPRYQPQWSQKDMESYADLQARQPGELFFITDDSAQKDWLESHGLIVFQVPGYEDFNAILEFAFKKGAINLMIESGPKYCQKITNDGLCDILLCFQSKKEIWSEGRGFALGHLIAQNNDKQIIDLGYKKIYDIPLEDHDVLIYARDVHFSKT